MESVEFVKPIAYIRIDQYEALVNGVFRLCDRWIKGSISGEQLLAADKGVYRKSWMIAELNGRPDEFDWSLVSLDLQLKGDLLCERFRAASAVMAAAKMAVFALVNCENQTSLMRAAEFGKSMTKLGHSPNFSYT